MSQKTVLRIAQSVGLTLTLALISALATGAIANRLQNTNVTDQYIK